MIKSLILTTFTLAIVGITSAETTKFPAEQKVLFTRGKLEIVEPGDKAKGIKKKVIEHKDQWGVKRYRIPHITKNPDGKLVVAIVGRCSVGGDHGKSTTFFAVSENDGKTWEYIRHNTDYENIESRPKTDFPLTERTQETQVLWYPAMKKYVATYLTKNAAWFTTSTDLKTWSTPTKSTFKGDENCKFWPSPSSLQIDDDGSLMLAVTGTEMIDGKKQNFARIMWTKDLKNFETSPSLPCLGNETAVCPVGDNKYFVTTRIKPERLNMTYNRKTKSWTKPIAFPQPAHWRCEVDLINTDGTLYLTTPTKGRARGTLYKSTDKGTTWNKATLLTEGIFAYSSLVKINNTTLGVVAERENGDIVFQTVPIK